jgi:hypothetical protein
MKKAFFFGIVLTLGFAVSSQATTVERLTLDDLVRKAHRIVAGKVIGQRTHWSPNGKLILTTYTIEVHEGMKGRSARTTELTTIGGRIGQHQLYVPGMAAFAPGEDAVVFIEDAGRVATIVGLSQGKFSIKNGEVSNAVADLTFSDGRPGRPMKLPLDTFKDRIRSLVRR